MDTVLSITALVVSVALGLPSLYFAWRSTKASEASADASKASATASEDSAKAAENMLAIERDREYDRVQPKLRGRLVPEPGGPDPVNAWLEIHLDGSTPAPLRSLLLTLPKGAGFARNPMGVGFPNAVLGFPEESWQQPPILPGHPARWRVFRSDDAHGTVVATAKCTREDGMEWPAVEVRISQDFEDSKPQGAQ